MTTENTNTGLDIADIQTAVAAIDLAAQEGAYKGWDVINRVAGVRTRLANFLEVVAAAQKAQAEQTEAASAAPTDAAAPATPGLAGPDGPSGPSEPDEAALAPGA